MHDEEEPLATLDAALDALAWAIIVAVALGVAAVVLW
jgi:hypothetical protein